MSANEAYQHPVERQVADHLENKSISLQDAIDELGLDTALANKTEFCDALDMHILCCSDCGYWYLPSLMHENEKGEDVCDDCD